MITISTTYTISVEIIVANIILVYRALGGLIPFNLYLKIKNIGIAIIINAINTSIPIFTEMELLVPMYISIEYGLLLF